MIVIGADTHKRNHTLVAVDGKTGAARGQLTISATDAGSLDALRFAADLDEERVWAIEDCRHVSARLERALMAAGERVIRVPAAMTGQTRKVSRQAGKSDPIDARAVALAAVRDGVDSFPAAFLDDAAMEIRVINDYRDQIIWERTRLINRLRWHLVAIAPDIEAQLPPAALRGPRICARLTRQLARLTPSPQLRVARATLKRITAIVAEERELLHELTALLETQAPQLLAQPGCGPVTAAIIVGHTAGAQRFPTDGHFARHAGTAPVPASSGKTQRHRLHRGGDRQLNRAIHIIALSRAKTDPETRIYLDRKQAEGKTKLEAIRCLKRHLARRIWRLLYTATPAENPTTQTPDDPRRGPQNGSHSPDLTPIPANSRQSAAFTTRNPTSAITGGAPGLMPCVR
ncbi:MAG: IS110 family transposase [Solirubrobacteraceae bacterium]